ncbi:MAG: glycosyltransferase family 1 protein [Candidatus Omnitrophota bacterium]|nr:MAG: glycosyltransferase family 1 protein [Candidatus Omnitrophota bacterium]
MAISTNSLKNTKKKRRITIKKSLNIAHLHWGFPPIIGGVETHLTIILPQMVKWGHKVSLLTCSVEGVPPYEEYQGISLWRTPLMDLNWLSRRGLEGLEEDIENVFSSFIEKAKPDILHAHNMHYFSEVHARILKDLSEKKGIPLILTAHNVWDDILFLELTHKVNWTHIIAVSYYIKKEIIGIGVDDRKITVIHHGVDQEKFHPHIKPTKILKKYPQLKNRKVIFHPARIGLAKGCDISIKAINLVREKYPEIILVLAGSKNIIDWDQMQQKDIAYMVNLIKHFRLEENILIDFYSLEEMKELYILSCVCVYPSTVPEPFGLTMLEAQACSRPMVVTYSGGMPEVIKDGVNGFVVNIRDFEDLAAKIIQLLEDNKLRCRLGYTGRQIIESHYTKERVTQDTLNLYKKFT